MVAVSVVVLAFAVRLMWVLLVPTKPVGDFAMYWESAEHLLEHGALDPEFVYMPGYVILLAAVRGLGGGVLAAKIVGVVLATAGVAAVQGIAHHLWDRRAGLIAGLLAAFWPAGIAVVSVTGTDLPSGALVALALWALVRWSPSRPLLAAVLFGAVMGLAAWMRAVALPLAGFACFYYLARRQPWRALIKQTAVGVLAAAVVLLPWALRNQARYGELFFTDSHGGLTALVGANPNSDGAYSRSLNRIFHEVTGYQLLAEPHRKADRASYELAKDWTRQSPAFALGLVVKKAERLLANERPLLYWPLFRAGVLQEPQQRWFARHRAGLEQLVDLFWAGLVVTWVAGLVIAVQRRRYELLAIVPVQLALVGIYALFFAEVRYHLPIALLMFPAAGVAVATIVEVVRARAWPQLRSLAVTGGVAALVLVAWQLLLVGGERLRERHRFAVSVCRIDGQPRVCSWHAPDAFAGPSGVRGVWNGVGVTVRPTAALLAEARLMVPAGRYRFAGVLDAPGLTSSAGAVRVQLADAVVETPASATAAPVETTLVHPGGELAMRLSTAGTLPAGTRIWLSHVVLERL